MDPKGAIRIMNLIRIIAIVLIIASAILYFAAKEYAIYPAITGFVMIALINLPLHIWLSYKQRKMRKGEEKQD
ncbi:MAG: hypothetical protein RQ761_06135 [Bacteroidales bacterium]|nr:hypothetical protein [Bacteroidales bacterium]